MFGVALTGVICGIVRVPSTAAGLHLLEMATTVVPPLGVVLVHWFSVPEAGSESKRINAPSCV